MKAHIVGGGFGGLSAAALLIRNADVPGTDITIYEAGETLGGGLLLGGNAARGYDQPGSVFDKQFRCTFDLLKAIPSARDHSKSVTEDFFAFNNGEPYDDKAHVFDRNGRIEHRPRFGLSVTDGLSLARMSLTPKRCSSDGVSRSSFPRNFSRPNSGSVVDAHGVAAAAQRHRVSSLHEPLPLLFGDLYDMTGVMRTPLNRRQNFIEPLVKWLTPQGVNFLTGAFVKDIGFAPVPRRITVNRLDCERNGAATPVAVAPEDIVLITTGSQAADLSPG